MHIVILFKEFCVAYFVKLRLDESFSIILHIVYILHDIVLPQMSVIINPCGSRSGVSSVLSLPYEGISTYALRARFLCGKKVVGTFHIKIKRIIIYVICIHVAKPALRLGTLNAQLESGPLLAKSGPGLSPLLIDQNWAEFVFYSDGSQQTRYCSCFSTSSISRWRENDSLWWGLQH